MSQPTREGSPPDGSLVDVAAIPVARTLDVRGARPDAILLRLRNAVSTASAGAIIQALVDESAVPEVRAWAQLSGNPLTHVIDAGGHTSCLVAARTTAYAETPDWGLARPPSPALRDWLTGRAGTVPEAAPVYYGLVPRGAVPEDRSLLPSFPFTLNARDEVWSDPAIELYEQAKAQAWNPARDIAWDHLPALPDDLEWAVCQLMTFLAENEYAALLIPSRFLPRVNPQYTEVLLFLSAVIGEEARHIEAFTRRALANGGGLQHSSALAEWSLHTLLVQEDYFRSSFLLHVLGEGTFLELLEFIERHAPDPVTADVVRRARADEGRHVAYGIAHVRHVLGASPSRVDDLVDAAEERAATLQATSGANPLVLEALATIAGGGSSGEAFGRGLDLARDLYREMDAARVQRMRLCGIDDATARKVSALHSPNFM